jgi:hypothetical protein
MLPVFLTSKSQADRKENKNVSRGGKEQKES